METNCNRLHLVQKTVRIHILKSVHTKVKHLTRPTTSGQKVMKKTTKNQHKYVALLSE